MLLVRREVEWILGALGSVGLDGLLLPLRREKPQSIRRTSDRRRVRSQISV